MASVGPYIAAFIAQFLLLSEHLEEECLLLRATHFSMVSTILSDNLIPIQHSELNYLAITSGVVNSILK